MWIDTVTAAKTKRPQPPNGIGEILRFHFKGHIAPVEVVVDKRLLEHVLRGISTHMRGEQGQERLHGGTGHGNGDL